MRPFASDLARLALLVPLTLLALPACSDDTGGPGLTDTGGDVGSDADGPACTGHVDCVGKVAGLGTCQAAFCDPASNTCVVGQAADFATCEDDDPCSAESWCESGSCVAGTAVTDCDDGSPCTVELCKEGEGCVYTPVTGPCDDGDPCTSNDLCGTSGTCAGTPTGQCGCIKDEDCGLYEDGNLCNGTLECVGAQCRVDPTTVVTCDDAGPCAENTCNPLSGQCKLKAKADGVVCSDGDACTTGDTCAAGACVGEPVCTCQGPNDCALLEDSDLCNGRLTCSPGNDGGGLCVLDGATVVSCAAPSSACHVNACHPASGTCAESLATDGTPCATDDPCVDGARCQAGACAGGLAKDCNDGNPCTLDLCVEGAGCEHQSNEGAICDDADPCTTGDKCAAGVCASGNNVCGVCGDNLCSAAESCDTCPNDCGECQVTPGCGNGVCETGEELLCPQDCSGGGTDVCGDGVCGAIEFLTCPDDCSGGGGLCDNVCDNFLDLILCPTDCEPVDPCGDGVCDTGEELLCPEDCEVVAEPEPDAGPTEDVGGGDAGTTDEGSDLGPSEEVIEDVGPVEDTSPDEDAGPADDAVETDVTVESDAAGDDAGEAQQAE